MGNFFFENFVLYFLEEERDLGRGGKRVCERRSNLLSQPYFGQVWG
jgi:hypothetical protein